MPSPNIIEIPDNGGTVAVMADLHHRSHFWLGSNPLQFYGLQDRVLRENVDALIVAGDLSDTFGPSLQDALAYLTHYVPADRIYVVPGNHDYYAGRLDDENRLRDLVHTSGSWFFDMISIEALGHVWLDPDEVLPRHIVPVTPEDIIAVHRDHRAWLEERLATSHFAGNGRTFVVTHHGPHPSAAGPIDGLTPAFHSDLTEVIERSDIETWFFGHSHRRLSSMVAGTRIQNISIGYPDEVRELPAARQPLEQDFEYALRCSETGIPVLADKLTPSTRASLSHALRGCACPVVPEGDAYYATDVIVALGRAATPEPPDANGGDQ